eukprot:2518855-Prymnesium_polylepis.1
MSTSCLSWSSTRPLITRGGSLVRAAWVTRAATMLRACAARGASSLSVREMAVGTACAVCAMWARATGRV